MRKRWLSTLLALSMVLALLPQTARMTDSDLPFTDVKAGAWYCDAVKYVHENGLIDGISPGIFAPDEPATRAVVVTALYRLEGCPAAKGETFTDVGPDCADAAAWASASKIAGGYGGGRFGADNPIIRQDMAAILYRYAQHLGQDVSSNGVLENFSDAGEISSYAWTSLAWAVGEGLISGVGEGRIAPGGTTTRAQVATLVMRLGKKAGSADTVPASAGQAVIERYNAPDREGAAFLTDIAPFTGKAAAGELSASSKKLLAAEPRYTSLTANCLTVDGTPLYEVYKDDGTEKPLVFLLHGGGGSKDDPFGNACDLACMGLYAVCLDAAGCGDSQKGPLDALACFAETVCQLDTVIEYYNTVDGVNAAKFGICGGSMGGNIAFAYVGHGKYRPAIIAPSLATPDYTLLSPGPLYDCFDHGHGGEPIMTREEVMEFAERYAPINWPERFLDTYIFAANGMADDITGPEGCMALEKKLKELGGSSFTFNYYEGYGHEGLPADHNTALAEHLLH